jgi:membrane associated rhomboid family serine protease
MSLADRTYMRDEDSGRAWSPTIVILVINVVVFLLEASGGPRSQQLFREYGAVSLEGIKNGFVWQLLTYQFMHGGLMHLLLNSIGLYLFGRYMEMMLGRKTFIKLYLLSGIAGGVLQLLLALISPRFAGPMVGASAGICGLVAAFSLLSPDSTIYIFLVVPLRAKFVLPLTIVISVVFIVMPSSDGVAHGAHLGGTLFGYAYLRWSMMFDPLFGWFAGLWERMRGPRPARPIIKVRFPKGGSWQAEEPDEVRKVAPVDFITKEVDPILEKISAHGIQSLTDRERKILEAAKSRMEKR